MEQPGKAVTTAVSVFTRHNRDCPQTNPQWKRCKCRKSLYIYDDGKDPVMGTSGTSSQAERDKRDPIKQEQRELDVQIKQVAQDQADSVARQITVRYQPAYK
jgi:hypothetical protein